MNGREIVEQEALYIACCVIHSAAEKLDITDCQEFPGMPYVIDRLREVPITHRPRVGTTKLCSWTEAFKILTTILKGRFIV